MDNKFFKIGIIGFGRFGQFLAKKMVQYGFTVYVTNRTNYSKIAKEIGAIFVEDSFLNIREKLDIIIFSVSIFSFENILKSYPINFWKNKLIVDVLSVKVYPQKIIQNYLKNVKCDILLTHPMFGPDSANESWINKNFIWWIEKNNTDICSNLYKNNSTNIEETSKLDPICMFLDFWKKEGCNMIEMNPEEHDKIAANSQFLTHFIGRLLELLNCEESNIDTDGYKSLLTIKNHTMNDSWDLFLALAKFNPKSLETIKKIKNQLNHLEEIISSDIEKN